MFCRFLQNLASSHRSRLYARTRAIAATASRQAAAVEPRCVAFSVANIRTICQSDRSRTSIGTACIDPAQGPDQCQLVEVAVVVDPASDIRVVFPCQILQGQVAPMMEFPSPDRLPDCFQRVRAGGGQERDAVLTPAPLRSPRPECVAEEIERLDRKVATPVRVLAVDELRLLRVQNRPAGRKARLQGFP